MYNEIGYEFWLKQIGLNVSFYRNLIGEKQDAFAERVGISRTYLSSIEAPNMVTPPSLQTLYDIACALEIDPIKLFEMRKLND